MIRKKMAPQSFWKGCFGIALGVIVAAGVIFFPSMQKDVVFSQQQRLGIEEHRILALEAEQKKDLGQAIWHLRQMLELQKNDPQVLERLARLYILTGQLAQALEYAQQLAFVSPASPAGYFYLGMADHLLGQSQKAQENFQKAVSVDPGYAEAYFNLGFLSESNGRLTEAIDYYKRTIGADPKHTRAYYNLGNAYAGLDRSDEAIEAYQAAIAQDPNYTDALVNLSILLTQKKSYIQAIQYLDEARLLGYEAPELYLKTLEPYREAH